MRELRWCYNRCRDGKAARNDGEVVGNGEVRAIGHARADPDDITPTGSELMTSGKHPVDAADFAGLQPQARALGDPTRHRIFRFVVDAARPVDVAELTAHVELNHNAVRQHLSKLVSAGLLVEQTARGKGRGRPRLVYTVHPSAESRWGVAGPYERLSLLLSEIIRTGDSPIDVGRRAGRRARLGRAPSAEPLEQLVAQMARYGFEPEAHPNAGGLDIRLRACPYTTTALADPDTVCQLHLGLAYGVAETLGDVIIDELVPRDPRRGQCILRCHTAATTAT